MSAPRHTPGEWEADGLVVSARKYASNNRTPIAMAATEDDALLFAAALDIYDALEKALAESGCDGDLCAHEWHEAARRALSKARGE